MVKFIWFLKKNEIQSINNDKFDFISFLFISKDICAYTIKQFFGLNNHFVFKNLTVNNPCTMDIIPSTSTLRALANQSLEEQNNFINALQIPCMRKKEMEILELRVFLLDNSDFKSRLVKLLA